MDAVDQTSLKRMLLQQLRGLRRAGVSSMPHVAVETPLPTPLQASPPVASEKSRPAVIENSMPSRTTSRKKTGDPAARLAAICDQVAGCQRCQELASTRTQTVFGVGDPAARVLFIGEAPGADEDKQGIPFVGRAGQLMDRIIEASQLKREDIYICNILKCRPPGNRNPSPEEANNCREYLDAQLEIVNPEYIVCWGAVAAQNLLDTTVAIGKLRKKFHDHNGAKVLCTYHPSYLLRNPAMKKEVWADMQLLMAELGLKPA